MNPSGFDRVANIGTVNGKVTRDYNEYLKMGGQNLDSGASTSGLSSTDPSTAIRSALEISKQAYQPAIDQLKPTIDQTNQAYDKQRGVMEKGLTTLQDRYKTVLDSIKGNQQVAENRQTLTTGNELAKRGLSSDSGLYQQEVTNALQPVTAQYAGLSAEAGLQEGQQELQQQNLIGNTYGQQVGATNAISQAIASLLGNSANSGLSTGASLYGTNNDIQLKKAANDLASKQFDYTKSTDERDFNEKVREFNQEQARLGANSSLNGLKELLDMFKTGFGSGTPSREDIIAGRAPVPGTNKTVTGRLADGRYLYSDGSMGWGGF